MSDGRMEVHAWGTCLRNKVVSAGSRWANTVFHGQGLQKGTTGAWSYPKCPDVKALTHTFFAVCAAAP
jgi:hypothetical protein